MNRYLVYMPKGYEVIPQKFPNSHLISDNLWAVGSPLATCAGIVEELGIGADREGVVVQISRFDGFFDMALWNSLNVWAEE